MSVNITVNGKFARHCGRNTILDDAERVKKELMDERRIQRLQDVRAESKNLARKIRTDVAEEKERQLRKLEAIKAQELNCWREHVLAHKNHDYRAAIFQVGSAHNAAKVENELRATKQREQKQQPGAYKDFRKQIQARRSCQNAENQQNKANIRPVNKAPERVTEKPQQMKPEKRKRHICFNEQACCCCSASDSDSDDQSSTDSTEALLRNISSTSCSKSDSEVEEPPTKCTQTTTKGAMLRQTPAVVLDVEVDSNDSVNISMPAEIRDRHVENNRQFSRVVRKSPRKATAKTVSPKKPKTPPRRQSRNNETSRAEVTGARTSSAPKEPVQVPKRFTQISDLIHRKKTQPVVTRQKSPKSPAKERSTVTESMKAPPPTPKSITPRKSSATTSTAAATSVKTATTATVNRAESGTGSSGRVQFYDYNNKFAKDYPQQQQQMIAVHLRPSDHSQSNAIEQASIERQLREAREHEIELLRKKSEERGQKAIEREQVRRDCLELTEKLDAMTRQQPQLLPSDANLIQSHRYADIAVRKETKMNSAVEEILMRPAIITCPELRSDKRTTSSERPPAPPPRVESALNLGSPHEVSSDSCCSILLGYVNDQSKQVRHELGQCQTPANYNQSKAEKLKNLLERIEQLRKVLLKELESGQKAANDNGGNVQQVIESISDLRKERENIFIDGGDKARAVPLKEREKLLQQKEAILEQHIREFYEKQKAVKSASKAAKKSDSENSTKPLEIVIKVKGAKCSKGKSRTKTFKSPRKVSTLIQSPSPKKATKKRSLINATSNVPAPPLNRQNSYDSNSTSYRSLPPKLTATGFDALVDQLEQGNEEDSVDETEQENETEDETETEHTPEATATRSKKPKPSRSRLNPLVAHYVQRLLGMTRNSITALGVSSSTIETPSSSVIDTTTNITPLTDNAAADLSQERLERVQNFIEENRGFIHDLEESLRSHTNQSLETSMRVFEEIWKQRLRDHKLKEVSNKQLTKETKNKDGRTERVATATQKKQLTKRVAKLKVTTADSKVDDRRRLAKDSEASKLSEQTRAMESAYLHKEIDRILSKDTRSAQRTPLTDSQLRDPKENDRSSQSKAIDRTASTRGSPLHVTQEAEISSQNKENNETTNRQPVDRRDSQEMSTKKIQTDLITQKRGSKNERYAQLTDNCTNRIAELTALISKVREEKQRLLEVTLSSASENERPSTEYLDLPESKGKPSSFGNSTGTTTTNADSSQSKLLDSNLVNEQPTSSTEALPPENIPLEKNKFTGTSRDSGISMSRPMTAQEQHNDMDPPSFTSTQTHSSSQRKAKPPPPTLKRFSPLLIEDDLVHELSTILEVDTPVTSRVNTSAQQPVNVSPHKSPVAFPTFEQYAQELNLDLTQLDPEQSMLIQHEFNELVEALKDARGNRTLNYEEFPSLTAYLHNITASGHHSEGLQRQSEHSPESVDDLLACLRLANLTIKSFPSQKEYMNRLATNTPEQDLIDTESLENITEVHMGATETDSESLNIEEELKRRNILKKSFRSTVTSTQERVFSSTIRDGGGGGGGENSRIYAHMIAAESGIEKLSTSDNLSDDLERDLRRMGLQWPTSMRRKGQEAAALSSTTTTTSTSLKSSAQMAQQKQQQQQQPLQSELSNSRPHFSGSSDFGRPLNLREFLTKELLKYAHNNTSSSSSNTDESLRSQFFHSIIGSMTPPTCTPRTNGVSSSGVRQKTSTPVMAHSTQTQSHSELGNSSSASTGTHLFSGESRLSSVHFQNGSSVRFAKQGRGDRSGQQRHDNTDEEDENRH